MTNRWLDIPLTDYEGHMASPQVAQAQLLGDTFEQLLRAHAPPSVAVLGCAGGNGLERIDIRVTTRVVGVDINAAYLDALRERYAGRFQYLELVAGDVQGDALTFQPVAMAFAALLFEYVDVALALRRIRPLIEDAGILGTVVQLPSDSVAAVSPSPFASIQTLAPCMRLVPPSEIRGAATQAGFSEIDQAERVSVSGKRFHLQVFRAM